MRDRHTSGGKRTALRSPFSPSTCFCCCTVYSRLLAQELLDSSVCASCLTRKCWITAVSGIQVSALYLQSRLVFKVSLKLELPGPANELQGSAGLYPPHWNYRHMPLSPAFMWALRTQTQVLTLVLQQALCQSLISVFLSVLSCLGKKKYDLSQSLFKMY